MADLAAEADQTQVKLPHERRIGREELVHPPVRIFPIFDKAQSLRYALDMRIYREVRPIKREEHHDSRRLPPHAGKRQEPAHRLL